MKIIHKHNNFMFVLKINKVLIFETKKYPIVLKYKGIKCKMFFILEIDTALLKVLAYMKLLRKSATYYLNF